jgi:hypothetical protein
MQRVVLCVVLALISGCSDESAKQVTSTAGMGAAMGIPGGPIGIAVGGVIGAVAGAFMPPGSLDEHQKVATN